VAVKNAAYVRHAELQFPSALKARVLAAGIPWIKVLEWIGQWGLPIVMELLTGFLNHANLARTVGPAPTPPEG
jgi:hypothetical protein